MKDKRKENEKTVSNKPEVITTNLCDQVKKKGAIIDCRL